MKNGQGTRTHDTHVATQNIIELWQLIQIKFLNKTTYISSAFRGPFSRIGNPITPRSTFLIYVGCLDEANFILRKYLSRAYRVITKKNRPFVFRY